MRVALEFLRFAQRALVAPVAGRVHPLVAPVAEACHDAIT